MIQLFDKDSGAQLGTISDEEWEFLHAHLEAESPGDDDYYINADTLDAFTEQGGPTRLLDLLRTALGARADMEVRWVRS
jgi:hypothetical protein